MSALDSYLNDSRVLAFLDTIAVGEGTGYSYNVLYGGRTFSSYAQHPGYAGAGGHSAAGRYQFLYTTWQGLQRQYGFSDFSPRNQDLGAVALLLQCGALSKIQAGDFQGAVAAARGIWPSLPGGTQQTRTWSQATATYNAALAARGGGSVSSPSVPSVTIPTYNPVAGGLSPFDAIETEIAALQSGTPLPQPKPQADDSGVQTAVVALIGFLLFRRFFL